MALPWFKHILGNEKRTQRRWVSGHLDKGEKRKREHEIGERIAVFKQKMDQQGVVFREDRDAWEAYWDENPRAHKDLSGDSIDEALGEQAFRVFRGYWQRLNKQQQPPVRFEGDGLIPQPPALLALGKGAAKIRANPIDALKSNDPDERARAVERIDDAIERCDVAIETGQRRRAYLEKVRKGLQDGAIAIEMNGEVIVQGLLTAPEISEVMEEIEDDATE